VPMHTLTVTSAEDTADARNRVEPAERDAFLGVLRRAGVPHAHVPTLRAAIARTLDAAGRRDLVLLLGAQGMDAGADLAREALRSR
jgi:UDP-N-acetylmuramoyl-L-alanyl-D-glutamate--2,6-diaminopimelate ligase